MKEHLTATDWVAERGKRWQAQLAGMEAMLAPIDEPLIESLRLDSPCRIAEVGCGGGRTTLEILQRAPKGSVVHGFDLSKELIESARRRKPAGNAAIDFQVADMAAAAPPEPLYDRLVSRFGVMFFDDPPAAFANLVRWLSIGGRFSFAVWGSPEDNPWMTSVRAVVAEVMDLPPLDREAPGPFRYGDAGKFLGLLDRAGFSDLTVTDWRGALQIGGGLPAKEAAHFALASFSSFHELLATHGKHARDRAYQYLSDRFAKYEQDGAVRLNACVHIVTGQRLR